MEKVLLSQNVKEIIITVALMEVIRAYVLEDVLVLIVINVILPTTNIGMEIIM